MKRCQHCNRLCSWQARGLCPRCHRDPEVRGGYPAQYESAWGERDLSLLEDLLERSLTDRQIAAALGRSVHAVKLRRLKLGIEKHCKLSPHKASLIREGHAAGLSLRQLAQQYGVSHTQVWRVVCGHAWRGGA